MRLIHHSREPLRHLYSVTQDILPNRLGDKPNGIWLSIPQEDENGLETDEWEEFVREDYTAALPSLANSAEFRFREASEILLISEPTSLDDFTNEFGREFNRYLPGLRMPDWKAVAARWKGIAITPYIHERRLHRDTQWYYGWDVASACVWDVSCLERVYQSVSEAA